MEGGFGGDEDAAGDGGDDVRDPVRGEAAGAFCKGEVGDVETGYYLGCAG